MCLDVWVVFFFVNEIFVIFTVGLERCCESHSVDISGVEVALFIKIFFWTMVCNAVGVGSYDLVSVRGGMGSGFI